jgi:hypothetical protein
MVATKAEPKRANPVQKRGDPVEEAAINAPPIRAMTTEPTRFAKSKTRFCGFNPKFGL